MPCCPDSGLFVIFALIGWPSIGLGIGGMTTPGGPYDSGIIATPEIGAAYKPYKSTLFTGSL